MMALLLTGCAGRREETFERWRSGLEGKTLSFTAEIVTHGETAAKITAAIRREGEETLLTVLSPETIAGTAVRTTGAERTLEYGDLVLDLTPLREEDIPPCAAGDRLLETLLRGRLLWTEGTETAALSLREGETVILRRNGDGVPVSAEIQTGDRTALTLEITEWSTGD